MDHLKHTWRKRKMSLMTKPWNPWINIYAPLLHDFEKELDNWSSTYVSHSSGYENATTIELVLTGVKKEDVRAYILDRNLFIEYIDRKGRKCREVKFVGNATGATAKLEHGLLTIELSRPQASKIDIEVK
jgi:HSP20 family molecular chaperone IbpA